MNQINILQEKPVWGYSEYETDQVLFIPDDDGCKMMMNIKTIRLALPYRMGNVNCYLIETGEGFILIDTGGSNRRRDLRTALDSAGCKPGDLRLILMTHGDFDHTGNAAYLCENFGAKIAMHADDIGMAEHGDMFWNRKSGGILLGKILSLLSGFGKSERFTPDLSVGDGDNLAEYGLNATVLSIPGHSRGSIGVLTADGVLFCGDLLENIKKPALNSIMDDMSAANTSLDRLKSLEINAIYPGHGEPFTIEQFP